MGLFKWNKNKVDHLDRIKKQVIKRTKSFDKQIKNIENYTSSLFEQAKKFDEQIKKIKRLCHSLDILVSDKDADLKMIFANDTLCSKIYSLPLLCTDQIIGRYESDIINDSIELNKKWNSFVECGSFNIDEIVKKEMKEMKFLQQGQINDNEIVFLITKIKPHIENEVFDGLSSFSTIINKEDFEKNKIGGELLYNNNNYIVYNLK